MLRLQGFRNNKRHPFQSSSNLSIRASFCVCRVICTFLSKLWDFFFWFFFCFPPFGGSFQLYLHSSFLYIFSVLWTCINSTMRYCDPWKITRLTNEAANSLSMRLVGNFSDTSTFPKTSYVIFTKIWFRILYKQLHRK